MNNESIEFKEQLQLDVLLNGLSEVTENYVYKFDWQVLDEIVIPDGIKTIGRWAFSGCTGLTSITIPKSVKSIGNSAFSGCSGLMSVTIPDSVTSIESSVFYYCHYLKNVTFINKTIEEVRSMTGYPWGIKNPEKVICVQVA